MKKYLRVISLVLLAAVALTMTSCGTDYTTAQMTELLRTAVANSEKAGFYYYKETTLEEGGARYRTVNLLSDIGNDYEPVTDAEGNYPTKRLSITESLAGKNTFAAICGPSTDAAGQEKSYLFVTSYDAAGKETAREKCEAAVDDYLASEAFAPYSLDTVLKELEYLTAEDMSFDVDSGGLEEKMNVRKFTFKITPEYLERYKREFGEESVFQGTTFATIETAYDRISEVVTYFKENLDSNLSIDTEAYKLQIVYLGPKFSVPAYDAVTDGKPTWQDAELLK